MIYSKDDVKRMLDKIRKAVLQKSHTTDPYREGPRIVGLSAVDQAIDEVEKTL